MERVIVEQLNTLTPSAERGTIDAGFLNQSMAMLQQQLDESRRDNTALQAEVGVEGEPVAELHRFSPYSSNEWKLWLN